MLYVIIVFVLFVLGPALSGTCTLPQVILCRVICTNACCNVSYRSALFVYVCLYTVGCKN